MTMPGVMTKFKIHELSAVDSPAQKGARATIMKRDSGVSPDDATDSEGEAMSLTAIAKALGLAETADEAAIVAAIGKSATSVTALETAQTELRVAKAKASMNDKEKTFMNGKTDDEVCKFMERAPEARAAEIAKHEAGDETVEIDGQTISKRVVGDAQFAVFKSMAKRLSDSEAEIKKARDEVETATFAKRASDEFPHLAGSVDDRAAVLKFLAKADDKTKAAAEAIFKAAEAAAKFAFMRKGAGDQGAPGEGSDAEAKIEKRIVELRKADKDLTHAQAYAKALREDPALYAELSGAPREADA